MASFFAELKRRHIYRVAAAYAVVAWVLLQLVNNVAPVLDLPPWIARAMILLLAIGFPVALVLAWVLELKAADATARAATGKLDWVLIGALVVVIGLVSYQQLVPSNGANKAQQESVATPAPSGISIAVLPFVNLSDDRQQEFFSDGITEEITSALAKVQNLRVVGRTSAFEFKGQNKDLRAIGQALGATHLVEGSVRKDGNQLRITAQLIKADDGTHLWTESYDRELKGVFVIQEEIATAIAAALKVPLGLQQGETLVSNRTSDPESYDQYLRARALFRDRAIADAIKTLESVVAREPGFAPAWALLSQAYALTPVYSPQLRSGSLEEAHVVAKSSLDKGEMAAREAVRLDSRSAETYGGLAFVQGMRGQWAAAEDRNKQALGLDPNNTELLIGYSVLLAATGRIKDALSVGERLRRLDPFVPQYNLIVADFMQAGGHSEASIPIIEAITGDAAGVFYRSIYLAQAYAAAGRYADAADALLAIKGENLVSQRSVQDAARLLRLAPAKAKDPQNLPKLQGDLYFVYAHIGAPERAMEHPERLLELDAKDPLALVVLWAPEFVQVRKTERFKTFVRKIGFVDYWRERGWPDLCRPMGANDFICD